MKEVFVKFAVVVFKVGVLYAQDRSPRGFRNFARDLFNLIAQHNYLYRHGTYLSDFSGKGYQLVRNRRRCSGPAFRYYHN